MVVLSCHVFPFCKWVFVHFRSANWACAELDPLLEYRTDYYYFIWNCYVTFLYTLFIVLLPYLLLCYMLFYFSPLNYCKLCCYLHTILNIKMDKCQMLYFQIKIFLLIVDKCFIGSQPVSSCELNLGPCCVGKQMTLLEDLEANVKNLTKKVQSIYIIDWSF